MRDAPKPTTPGLWGRASVLDRINAIFLTIVVLFAAVAFGRIPYKVPVVLLYAAFYAVLYGVGRLRYSGFGPRVRTIVLFAYPPLFLLAMFESFTLVMPYFRSARFDDILTHADHAVFGLHPTVWFERMTTPWLTDALYALYFFYFPMPLLLLIPMFNRRRFENLERWFSAFLFTYFGAYLICFFLPAEGPRFYLQGEQSVPLTGPWLAEPIRRLIDAMEPNKLDAFPSLHAGILAMIMACAWREARRTFWIFAPLAVGITLSLVYLRYHYVVDVAAGIAWASIAWFASGAFHRRVSKSSAPHFGPESLAIGAP